MIKLTFDKDKLLDTVNPMMCAVNEHSTSVAMAGILFEPGENDTEMTLYTYDMDKGMQRTLPCVIEESGSFIINAGKLQRIVRTMPGPNITLEIDEKYTARIYSGTAEFKIRALPGSDFPKMPPLRGEHYFDISRELLKRLIGEVQFAIAVNDQRAALNGAYFEVYPGKIKVCSCDGSKMAMRECASDVEEIITDEKMIEYLRFIVPGRSLSEAVRLIGDTGKIRIGLTYRHIFFFEDDLIFFTRIIDSEFIDYNRFVRKESKINVYLSREAFLGACERAALITEERTIGQGKSSLKCSFEDGVLHVSADNLNGSVQDDIPIEKDGEDIFIGFNCRYLMDALRACPQDSLRASLSSPLMSMQIEGESEDGTDKFLYMVLPVKMN